MPNHNSYNILINKFKAFAEGHFLLKNFTYGAITLADLQKFGLYPFMHIVPVDVSYETGVKNFSFDVFFADLPREEENKAEYQKETLSDLQRIAEDLLGEITNHRVLFGYDCSVISSRLVPFDEEFSNVLTGWNLSITLQIPYNWSACDTPASFNDFIVYNQSTGESAILEFKDSIVRDGGEVRLVNDVEFPDESYYYGTDSNGVRGWFAFPSDEVGLTCETLASCSLITDLQTNVTNLENDVTDLSANVVDIQMDITTIEGNITTLQSDVSDLETDVGLKANISDISAVGFSNDYNDLDNLPSIPDSTSDLINDSGFITINDVPTFISILSHEVKLGSTMTKGTAVYVSSADGTNMVVSPASNTTEATSSKTLGLLMSGGTTNAKVFVITEGLLAGLNTSTATIGDAVWLGVNGALIYGLANKPYAPAHLVFIGIVTRVNTNNGEIFVKVQNGFELKEIHDVLLQSVADNQVLQYESATQLWKNKTLDKTSVGLSNVDNTSDANKPISSATQTALNGKQNSLGFTPENISNKQNSLATDGTGTKYPSVDAVNIMSAIDRGKKGFSFFTDFLGNPAVSIDGLVQNTSVGNITSTTFIGGRTLSTTGAAKYGTGASASGYAYHISNTIAQLFFGGGQMNFETLVSIDTISSGTENYRTIHGYASGTGSSNELNGVFFTYDFLATANGTSASGNWICISVKNGVRTLTTTSIEINLSQFYKLRIQVNPSGSSATFYIDEILVATHTTNIPSYDLSQFVFVKNGINKTIGTNSRAMYVDYLGYENILTTPR